MENLQAVKMALSVKRDTFMVKGLDCPSCAGKVEKRVLQIEGVQEAILNFSTSKLYVKHQEQQNEILQAIKETGHEGTLLEGRRQNTKKGQETLWYQNKRTLLTFISGIFTLVGLILSLAVGNKDASIPFFALAMVTGGYHIAKSGLYAVKSLSLDMNFLMLVAAIGAAFLGEWSEGAAVVFLFSIGNTLQVYTMDKTRRAISQLMELAPNEALLKTSSGEVTVPVEELSIGDIVIIKPGERIPIDGTVNQGYSFVNQAPITGESIPVEKMMGSEVFAGTINQQGLLEIKVTKLVEDTTLSKIMNMVEEAQAEKAPSQQFVDKFAKYYTPIVVLLAVAIAFIPPLIGGGDFAPWIKKALILLVISCPCALVISTPVSIVSAIGNASKQGILIKGGIHLEEAGRIKAIAFDKTGTLTLGRPSVIDVEILREKEGEVPLRIAATLEKASEHPIGRAIVKKARYKGIVPDVSLEDFQAIIGQGVKGRVQGKNYYLGNPRLFQENKISLEAAQGKIEDYQKEGKTVVLLGDDTDIICIITVADEIRDMSKTAIEGLKEAGIESTIMLTGDHHTTAKTVAEAIGIQEFKSELLPENKLEAVKELIQKYDKVAMVGDGINDTPALATASVGIAMGAAGTDAALETADIALMGDDLNKLAYVVMLSRKTLKIITQNIIFSIVVKALFLILTFMGRANLWMAVFADTGASIIVILNGMRLLKNKSI
ncbi:cadmium, zinc and cobalt-transporting ATpase CadA [Clostridium aceticum]|uniref:Cd(2+)-exporting ATPase n=2 Tax=Clostridium aceticum TaxID=84022 RepID=A0A0G3WHP7_9CLOT|nr:heavy metal translocating P-type ATPase [Clostridium aceticum]AKL96959.1 cadmium, zinc and cobalt-transporting ATpase CadA [Clostridium aceticum]